MANHQEQDERSLMLHTAAIKLMQQDALLIERAIGILDRWMSQRLDIIKSCKKVNSNI